MARRAGGLRHAALALLLAAALPAMAESQRASFEVNIQLSRFSEPAVADHRCTHGRLGGGEPVVIRCPATVHVQALASTAAGYALRQPAVQMAADVQSGRYQFDGDGPTHGRVPPIELTISW